MVDPTPETQNPVSKLKGELLRLRVKRSESQDDDIRKALSERITQLEAELVEAQASVDPEPELVIPMEPATPEQVAAADQLVRQARVEKMRNNETGATELLRKASEVAPGAPAVLEALGDNLVERKRFGEAAKAYKQAFQFDPQNVGLERKHAMAVMGKAAAGSIEDQLRSGLGEASNNGSVSTKAAAILSAFLPGLGHIVLGRPIGWAILTVWIACLIWVALMSKDVWKLMGMVGGSSQPANAVVVVPLLIMAVTWFGCVGSLSTGKKESRRRVDHPTPPVNLPFD